MYDEAAALVHSVTLEVFVFLALFDPHTEDQIITYFEGVRI